MWFFIDEMFEEFMLFEEFTTGNERMNKLKAGM